jgi:hypothetical protein
VNVNFCFCAILQGDEFIRFGNRDYADPTRYFWWDKAQGSWQLEGPRAPGEYVVVELGRGMVRNNVFGLVDVKAQTFALPQSAGGTADVNRRGVALSRRQAASIIEALRSKTPYMWTNATEGAKAQLSGENSVTVARDAAKTAPANDSTPSSIQNPPSLSPSPRKRWWEVWK